MMIALQFETNVIKLEFVIVALAKNICVFAAAIL